MEDNVMSKPLGEEMDFFRQYNEVLFNQLEKKILDKETDLQQLRRSVDKYQWQFENISDVIFIISTDFNILSISPSVEKLLGYKAEDFIGRPASDLRHIFTSESFERAIANISKMLKGKKLPISTYTFVAKDGTLQHIEIHGSPLMRDGQVVGTISVARDITERKLIEEKLRFEEQRFRAFVENSSDIIVLINLEGIITYINPAVEKVLGFKPEERIGAKGFELIHPDDMKFLTDSFNILATDTNSPVIKAEMRLRHKDGSWLTLEAVGSNLVHDNVIEAVIVNYRDITERKRVEDVLKESEQRYRELSIIDDLTQLYNSRHFYAQLEIEIERSNRYGQPLTLLLLDIDKFKKFNDKYGHVEGDNVLSKLGQVIKRCLRDPDSAYRYGGEEFTIMLPMTTGEEGIVTAKRIQMELRKEDFSPVADQNINMTVSIGMAQYKPMEDMKTFVRRVDKLMYQAKKDGRDRICPDRIGRKQKSIIGST
jgi:diguanylate cyclase (GGDEF)-like protein/PAS domain S-box-containing protein